MKINFKFLIALALMLFLWLGVSAQSEANPLDSFEWLVGNKWVGADGNFHKFEWGLGRKSVVAKSYFIVDGEPKLVSEGLWFYNPEEKKIKGYFVADSMPFVFMEYTTEFENSMMSNQLKAVDKTGKATIYRSTWTPTPKRDGYSWVLFDNADGTKRTLMTGKFTKE